MRCWDVCSPRFLLRVRNSFGMTEKHNTRTAARAEISVCSSGLTLTPPGRATAQTATAEKPKFNAAVCDMGKNNPAGLAAYGTLIDVHGYRDTLARANTMTAK